MNRNSFRVPMTPAARAPEYQRQQAYPVPGLSDSAAGIARQPSQPSRTLQTSRPNSWTPWAKTSPRRRKRSMTCIWIMKPAKPRTPPCNTARPAELDTAPQGKDAMYERPACRRKCRPGGNRPGPRRPSAPAGALPVACLNGPPPWTRIWRVGHAKGPPRRRGLRQRHQQARISLAYKPH